jgi:plasmid stabilization system protein ParE
VHFPNSGRPGLAPGTHEIVAVWPYIIVYEIEDTHEVHILRIWHGAQRRD